MSLPRSSLTAAFFLLVLPSFALSQQAVSLDLAGLRDVTRSVEPGRYTIELTNVVPKLQEKYAVVVQHNIKRIPKLEKPTAPQGMEANAAGAECDVTSITNKIDEATTESKVDSLARELRSIDCAAREFATWREIVLQTVIKRHVGEYSLRAGEELVVTVERDEGRQQWKLVLDTGVRGGWNVGYGFVFLPDNNDEPFVETLGEDPARYLVRNEASDGLRFLPSVFYSWTPRTAAANTWSPSIVAGLGADITEPALFLGAALTYNRNVSLVLGGAVSQEKRLRSRYDAPNDTLAQSLTPDQLVRDRFKPNFFLGVTFRFDTSPFASPAKKESVTAKKESGADKEKPGTNPSDSNGK